MIISILVLVIYSTLIELAVIGVKKSESRNHQHWKQYGRSDDYQTP